MQHFNEVLNSRFNKISKLLFIFTLPLFLFFLLDEIRRNDCKLLNIFAHFQTCHEQISTCLQYCFCAFIVAKVKLILEETISHILSWHFLYFLLFFLGIISLGGYSKAKALTRSEKSIFDNFFIAS